MTSFLAHNDVFLTKISSFHPFKVVLRLNCRRKNCSTWCFEYFEKKCYVTSQFRRMTSFLAQNDVFWQFLTKFNSYHPFNVVLRLNCQRKSCSPWFPRWYVTLILFEAISFFISIKHLSIHRLRFEKLSVFQRKKKSIIWRKNVILGKKWRHTSKMKRDMPKFFSKYYKHQVEQLFLWHFSLKTTIKGWKLLIFVKNGQMTSFWAKNDVICQK